MADSRSRSTEETKVYLLSSVLSSPITSDSNKWFRKSFLASSKDIADEPDGLFFSRFLQNGGRVLFFPFLRNLYTSCVT